MARNKRSKLRPVPPTGLRDTWKLWRHCMCRHGWYPLIVAPIITVACLMDLYSSMDCQFARVNIGFQPTNEEWSESVIDIGFWAYLDNNNNDSQNTLTGNGHHNSTRNETSLSSKNSHYNNYNKNAHIIPGCKDYSSEFGAYFIQGDRAWSAARIMALSSGIAGITAAVTIWLMSICPLPACFVWPGVLLPSVLVGFLAGGAKFFLLDSAICSNRVWRADETQIHETADSCKLLRGAYFNVGSVCCFFVAVCLIFYNVPEKRKLDPDFGMSNENNSNDDNNQDSSEYEGDLEKGPRRSRRSKSNSTNRSLRSIDTSMERIPEAPEDCDSPPGYQYDAEERDSAPNQVIVANDDVESVMEKISVYLKESGSQFKMDRSVNNSSSNDYTSATNNSTTVQGKRLQQQGRSPEKDPKRRKSKMLPNDESTSGSIYNDSCVSSVTHESRKLRHGKKGRFPTTEIVLNKNSNTENILNNNLKQSKQANSSSKDESAPTDNISVMSMVTFDNNSSNKNPSSSNSISAFTGRSDSNGALEHGPEVTISEGFKDEKIKKNGPPVLKKSSSGNYHAY